MVQLLIAFLEVAIPTAPRITLALDEFLQSAQGAISRAILQTNPRNFRAGPRTLEMVPLPYGPPVPWATLFTALFSFYCTLHCS